jgi:hypothetical protein
MGNVKINLGKLGNVKKNERYFFFNIVLLPKEKVKKNNKIVSKKNV